MYFKEISASLLMIILHEITGDLKLSPAHVISGSSLLLRCQSTNALGSYTLYSEKNNTQEIYGRAIGSFKNCYNGTQPGFIFKCDFDNWIFNLTITNPVHNQIIYCNRTKGPTDVVQVERTIYVQVPVRRISLTPDGTVDVVSKNSHLFTCDAFDSRPAANITWYMENIILTANISSESTSQRELFNVKSTLRLTPTTQDHRKKLHCSAKNILEEKAAKSTEATLNILYAPPTAPRLTAVGSIAVNEGQNITLRCNLSTLGNPPVTWSWICGDDIITSVGINNVGTQSELTLTAHQKYNQKTCHCKATTTRPSLSYDQISNKQSITVFYVPPAAPLLKAVGSIAVNEGQTITLRCNLSTLGNPPVTWSWICGDDTITSTGINNVGTKSELTLTAHRKYNQKTCHCKATTTRPSLSYDQISNKQSITVFSIMCPVARSLLEEHQKRSKNECTKVDNLSKYVYIFFLLLQNVPFHFDVRKP